MKVISDSSLARIEVHLQRALWRLLPVGLDLPKSLVPLFDRLHRFVMSPGKRVRPQLCVWAFEKFSSRLADDVVFDVACAWEIFHAFLLMHDDVIDLAETRRQRPSFHRQMQALDHDSPAFGQNLAIIAGDLLFGLTMRWLAEMEMDPGVQIRLIRSFSKIACTTGLGQAIDLFESHRPLSQTCEKTLLCEYGWKTAAYTFEGPLLSGAILAGAGEGSQRVISEFACAVGQAFQLHNDLEDLASPAHSGCDLVQGKRTFTLSRARAVMTSKQQSQLDRRMEQIANGNGHAVELAEALRQDLRESGTIELTQRKIEELLATARRTAEAQEFSGNFALALAGLVDALETRYFLPVPSAARE